MKFILENENTDQFILIGDQNDVSGSFSPGSHFILGDGYSSFLLVLSTIQETLDLTVLGYFNSTRQRILTDVDVINDDIQIAILNNTYNYDPSAEVLADISSYEISGNGYSRQALPNRTWNTWADPGFGFIFHYLDADNLSLSASGGTITGKYFVMFDETLVDKPLICYGSFGSIPIEFSISDGFTALLDWNPFGVIGVK